MGKVLLGATHVMLHVYVGGCLQLYLDNKSGEGLYINSSLFGQFQYSSFLCGLLIEGTMCPKVVLSALGGLLDFFGHIGLPVYCLPSGPCPVGAGQFLPNFVCPGETVGTQHGVGREEEKSRVRDRVPRSDGLLLGVLDFVDLLRDSIHIPMVRLHLVLEIHNVRGTEAHTHGL